MTLTLMIDLFSNQRLFISNLCTFFRTPGIGTKQTLHALNTTDFQLTCCEGDVICSFIYSCYLKNSRLTAINPIQYGGGAL